MLDELDRDWQRLNLQTQMCLQILTRWGESIALVTILQAQNHRSEFKIILFNQDIKGEKKKDILFHYSSNYQQLKIHVYLNDRNGWIQCRVQVYNAHARRVKCQSTWGSKSCVSNIFAALTSLWMILRWQLSWRYSRPLAVPNAILYLIFHLSFSLAPAKWFFQQIKIEYHRTLEQPLKLIWLGKL